MANDTSPTRHSFFSKERFHHAIRPFYRNRKFAVLTIFVFALIGVVATFRSQAYQITTEETVRLANGKEIRLNQNINTLRQSLGSSLHRLNNQQYIYRSRPNAPIEAVMDLDNAGNVVVIHLTNQPNSFVMATGSRVGVSLDQFRYFLKNATSLSGSLALLRQNGLVLHQSKSSQYLFSDPCKTTRQADLVTLVVKGHENKVIRDLGSATCVDRH